MSNPAGPRWNADYAPLCLPQTEMHNQLYERKAMGLRTIVAAYVLCLGRAVAAFSETGDVPSYLDDGAYIIEKQVYDIRKGKNGGLESVVTGTSFHEVLLRREEFVLQELARGENNEYVPRGELFVGVSRGGAWVFERSPTDHAKSRVTIVPHRVVEAELPNAGGPVGNVLQIGYFARREFISLGASLLKPRRGEKGSYEGNFRGDQLILTPRIGEGGLLTSFAGRGSGRRETDIRWELQMESDERGTPSVAGSVLSLHARGGSYPLFAFRILRRSAISPHLDLATRWHANASPTTQRFLYDPEKLASFHVGSDGTVTLISSKSVGYFEAVRFNKMLIQSALACVSVLFGCLLITTRQPK